MPRSLILWLRGIKDWGRLSHQHGGPVMRTFLKVAALSAFTCLNAAAVPVSIQNPSFELPVQPEGAHTNGVITGWTSFACSNECAGVFNPEIGNPGFPSGTVPDGSNALYMIQRVAQTLTATLQGNTTYTLTLFVGNPNDRPDDQNFGFTLTTVGGGNVLSFNAPLAILSGSNGGFVERSATLFVPTGYVDIGKTLQINLYGPDSSGPGLQYVAFDNVRLDAAPVPEPASLALFFVGVIALTLRRKYLRNAGI